MARKSKEAKPESRLARPTARGKATPPTEQMPAAMNKLAMVREALQVLGNTAKPDEIAVLIKERYGVMMATGMVGAYKSVLVARDRPQPPRPRLTSDDRRMLAELIDRVGPEPIQAILDEYY
ncbi:MAG: hypothetical protein KF873_19850 [Gemmataceae bacterium]|nr:hypothetical protein [Gemmataceae bacterium]